MAHDLRGNDAFYGFEEGGWHNLGHVNKEQQTADETYTQFIGPVPVTKERLVLPSFPGLKIPNFAIVEHPSRWSKNPRVRGLVTAQYNLFTYEQAIEILDRKIPRHVNTMGLLNSGMLFVTYDLPTLSVKGDGVEGYLAVSVPIDGKTAARAFRTLTRIVCKNTFQMATEDASEMYRIFHDSRVAQNFEHWVTDMYTRFERTHMVAQDALTVLADHKIQKGEGSTILVSTYPEPNMPGKDCPPEVYETRVQKWELERTRVMELRDISRDLYLGGGTYIADTEATRGTAYGLFQAVVESENYRKMRGGISAAAMSVLFGERQETIGRAFSACMSISKN